MSNRIRYAFGRSRSGDFIAAISEHGLVALEFNVTAGSPADHLRARFPDAVIEEDAMSLATTVATLSCAIGGPAIGTVRDARIDRAAPALGLVASLNRLVRQDGSLAAGRPCAASFRAASRRLLPCIPR